MHEVNWNGQAKPVAKTWDELGPAQLPRVVAILYGRYTDPHQQKLELLAVLLGVSRPVLLRLTPVQLVQIEWLTDFVLAGPVTLTQVPLPALRLSQRGRLYASADALANLSFLEFAFADAYFVAYATSQQAHWLDQLVAVLYRPQRVPYRPLAPDYAGDRRQPFNENLVESHAARLARRVAPLLKLLIFTWYRGCRHALEQRYPHVFTPANEEQAKAHPDGWAFVLRELSGQAFGSFETGRQDAGQVLAKMNDDVAQAERQLQAQRASQPTH